MARRSPTWVCQRQSGGERCRAINPSRVQICRGCGKRKPPRKRPDHLVALELSYEGYVQLNGGEFCGICGRTPADLGKAVLDRDHDHDPPYAPRGLLCRGCNYWLRKGVTADKLRRALAYLERPRP